jgi:hypothetical protein
MPEAFDAFSSALFEGFLFHSFITHKCRTDGHQTTMGFILEQTAEEDRFSQNLTLHIFWYFADAILRCYQKINCLNSSYSRKQAQNNGNFE